MPGPSPYQAPPTGAIPPRGAVVAASGSRPEEPEENEEKKKPWMMARRPDSADLVRLHPVVGRPSTRRRTSAPSRYPMSSEPPFNLNNARVLRPMVVP